ncbi:MAG: NADH-ubiquinone oxidoreductase-F iron-sulfur binding region domain-containing protein [Planctomycetaceae bacterium]
MELLRELTRLQHERGCLDEATLRELSREKNVPLYRLQGLVSFYPHFRATPPPRVSVRVCRDVSCAMAGCERLSHELRDRLAGRDDVEITDVSCVGRCDTAPGVTINDMPVRLSSATTVDDLVALLDDLSPARPHRGPRRWKCDPYQNVGDHYGTVHSLVSSATDFRTFCPQRLKDCNLLGMGGAGFPAGLKWDLVAREHSQPKYVICNADESEPGTFKDRVILDELPHLVIEGMVLAALTIGAERGIVYLRHEYGREQQSLERALADARRLGLLGDNAAGSEQRFDIEIFISPGGYILGEETALLEALEDKRGEPRNKPPYPGTHGLWGKPTLINNVETFALATSILHHGKPWWDEQGKGSYCGLKFVSVSGDVEDPGVYEIPLGTTVAELIALAGGMKDGKRLQAFLPGGASSNFLTAADASVPLDFAAMKQAGSMLGTGAVIVIAEGRDLFALATNIVRFFRNESCGKCVPCRIGTDKAVALLEEVQAGNTGSAELNLLPELGKTLEQTSICGLGQVALNPMLSMMKKFPDAIPRN